MTRSIFRFVTLSAFLLFLSMTIMKSEGLREQKQDLTDE